MDILDALASGKNKAFAKKKTSKKPKKIERSANRPWEKAELELEAKRKAELEAKRKAELEAKEKADREAKEKAELEAKLKSEKEARERIELEARLKAEIAARKKAELESKVLNISPQGSYPAAVVEDLVSADSFTENFTYYKRVYDKIESATQSLQYIMIAELAVGGVLCMSQKDLARVTGFELRAIKRLMSSLEDKDAIKVLNPPDVKTHTPGKYQMLIDGPN